MRITVWNENIHEVENEKVRAIYPSGIHSVIANFVREGVVGAEVRTATLDQPENGLTDAVLENTDVMTWWGHVGHHLVDEDVVEKVEQRVLAGMGLIVLHSAHLSRIFQRLMGTSCNLRWREGEDRETVWTVSPTHPITQGVPHPIVIPNQEMYGEFFDIPTPDELVFISSYTGGEAFRSGCGFSRCKVRIFYFSPGHESYPVYYQPEIQRVLLNAIEWAYQPQISAIDTSASFESKPGWFQSSD